MNELYLWYGVYGLAIVCLLWIGWNLHRIADVLENINQGKD